jgi:DNA repair protein RecO
MSYQTYTTEAIVCGTWTRNTADKSFLLFTKEAGMLYAEARSIREERSRQRFALQDFSYLRVSLIKGKQSWKIGSIEPLQNFYLAAADKAARGSVVHLTKFLRRFYGGQEAAPELFDYMVRVLSRFSGSLEHREFAERVAQVYLLHELGYADTRAVPPFAQQGTIDGLAADATPVNLLALEKIIEKAVATSHL